jgi:ATPase subunit of ABC transporter with duplicated ATPase domains
VIAEAINNYEGAILMVSHDLGFTDQLKDFEIVDLGRLVK